MIVCPYRKGKFLVFRFSDVQKLEYGISPVTPLSIRNSKRVVAKILETNKSLQNILHKLALERVKPKHIYRLESSGKYNLVLQYMPHAFNIEDVPTISYP